MATIQPSRERNSASSFGNDATSWRAADPSPGTVDFVNIVGTDKVLLSVKNEMSQGLLRPQNGDGQDYKYVIMPMRV